jgi:hypothetical protein
MLIHSIVATASGKRVQRIHALLIPCIVAVVIVVIVNIVIDQVIININIVVVVVIVVIVVDDIDCDTERFVDGDVVVVVDRKRFAQRIVTVVGAVSQIAVVVLPSKKSTKTSTATQTNMIDTCFST